MLKLHHGSPFNLVSHLHFVFQDHTFRHHGNHNYPVLTMRIHDPESVISYTIGRWAYIFIFYDVILHITI